MNYSELNYRHYIDGEFVEGLGRTDTIICPGNLEKVAEVKLATAEQATAALEAADRAFPVWSAMKLEERGGWILKLRDAIAEERENLHELLVLESGKLNGHNTFEVDSLINYLTYFLEQAKCDQDAILRDISGGKGLYPVVREPIGVVVACLAWNFPMHNLATKLGPVLASGCTCVVKPATKTPLSTLYFATILDRIGFPKGVINIIAGDAKEISSTLTGSKIPAMLTMIGSTKGGLQMVRESATSIKKFSMELGGNAPVIVTPTANLKAAAAHTIGNKMRCAGQTCTAPQRAFVHPDVIDEFTKLCVAEAKTAVCGMGGDNANVGAMISESAVKRMEAIVADAREKGASVLAGGCRPEGKKGYYFLPTVLTNVTPDMMAYKEEIFGPILCIMPYTNLDDAIAKANDTEYGLASYVWARDYYEVNKISKGLQFGVVNVNGPGTGANYPHAGWKNSGIGADGSLYSLEEYTRRKGIRISLA